MRHALMIGNSDGIGLAATMRLLNDGWTVVGLSRSESPVTNPLYRHRVADVADSKYPVLLDELLSVCAFV